MDGDALKKAAHLAARIGHAFIATADATGLPHVAVARKIAFSLDEGRIIVEEWFCPSTMANLQVNRRLAIVVWDPVGDVGYQLLGEMTHMEDAAIMDGYAPGARDQTSLPQVERRLLVRVDRVIHFSCALHTDAENNEEVKHHDPAGTRGD
jgi:hypothetical protein